MATGYEWLLSAYGLAGDWQSQFDLGRSLESNGDLHLAAVAYDRAFGLRPGDESCAAARGALLDRLSIVESGISFRYIPAGSFLMGSESGDPDERPIHPVELSHYWLSETPISWSAHCDLMDWEPAPYGVPKRDGSRLRGTRKSTSPLSLYRLQQWNKIRLQYCEDATTRATDWHAHVSTYEARGAEGVVPWESLFGAPERDDRRRPWTYDRKPMVSVSWSAAADLCAHISHAGVKYRLPTEAEWEKAARGGIVGASFPWGNEPPSNGLCDYDRYDQFSILPMRRFTPNGYGLYAMSGCVWEWTSDWYDASYYGKSPRANPRGPARGKAKVLRGGSWADCAEAVTVSFRMSLSAGRRRDSGFVGPLTPNVGFRICRTESADGANDVR